MKFDVMIDPRERVKLIFCDEAEIIASSMEERSYLDLLMIRHLASKAVDLMSKELVEGINLLENNLMREFFRKTIYGKFFEDTISYAKTHRI